MARQTAQEKKIETLESQIETMSEEYDKCCEENNILREKVMKLESNCVNLQQEINRYNEEFEDELDESKQTIRSSTSSLIDSFNRIKCPITQRESFKQFVATVIDKDQKDIESKIEGFKKYEEVFTNAIGARADNLSNIKDFVGRVINHEVNYHS